MSVENVLLWKLNAARENRVSLNLRVGAAIQGKLQKKVPHRGKFFSLWHADLQVALKHILNPLKKYRNKIKKQF